MEPRRDDRAPAGTRARIIGPAASRAPHLRSNGGGPNQDSSGLAPAGGKLNAQGLSLDDVQRLAERLVQDARDRVAKLDAEARALEAVIEEARRAGFERGRAEGQENAQEEAREKEQLGEATAALAGLLTEIGSLRRTLLSSARRELLPLAMAIARKVVHREVREFPPVVLESVRRAIDLTFQKSALVVEVHPRDAALVERHASEAWGLLSGCGEVTIRPAEDIDRGGCRVAWGSGMVDLRLSTQLSIIEEALLFDSGASGQGGPPARGETADTGARPRDALLSPGPER